MATFPSINPSYSVIESSRFNTHIINYGNKIEQRVAINSLVQKSFKLMWKVLTPSEKGIIADFFVARKGAFESFTWVNPLDVVSYTVRFKDDAANFEYFDYLLWQLQTVEFVEVSA